MTSVRRSTAGILLLAAVAVLAVACFAVLADAYEGSGRVMDLDVRVEEWVAAHMPAWAEWLARPFTWLGGIVGVTIAVGIAVVVLLRAGRRADVVLLLAVTIGVQVTVALLKSAHGRPRPDAGSPIDLPQSTSFPSGHAATGIAVFGALAVIAAPRARSRAGALGLLLLGLALGVAIGASRVVLNVHFVSDVVAGFYVGLAWLCACLAAREVVVGRHA